MQPTKLHGVHVVSMGPTGNSNTLCKQCWHLKSNQPIILRIAVFAILLEFKEPFMTAHTKLY